MADVDVSNAIAENPDGSLVYPDATPASTPETPTAPTPETPTVPTIQVLNAADQKPMDVPETQVQDLFKSGQIGFIPGTTISVLSPDGASISTIPVEKADEAFQNDYTIAPTSLVSSSQEEQAQEAKYNTVGQTAGAFGEGAAKALSFGFSPAIEHSILGVPSEDIEQREARHPVASGLGFGTGLVAGFFVPGLGEAEAADAVPALSGAGRVYKSMVKGAALNAAFGIGDTISEADLGDHNLLASKLISSATTNALFGAAAGGVFGLAVNAISPVLDKAANTFAGFAEKTKSAMNAGTAAEAQPLARAQAARDLTNTLQESSDATKGFLNEAWQTRAKEKASILASMPIKDARDAYLEWRNNIVGRINAAVSDPKTYNENITNKILSGIKDLDGNIGTAKSAFEINKFMDDFKSDFLDKELKIGGTPTNSERSTINFFKPIRADLKLNLQNNELWGDEGDAQAAFNSAYNKYVNANNKVNKLLGQKVEDLAGNKPYVYQVSKVDNYLKNAALGDATVRADNANELLDNLHNTRMDLLKAAVESRENAGLNPVDQTELKNLYEKIQDQRVGGGWANQKPPVTPPSLMANVANRMAYTTGGVAGSLIGGHVMPGIGHVVGYHAGANAAGALMASSKVLAAGLSGKSQAILARLGTIGDSATQTLNSGIKSFMAGNGPGRSVAFLSNALKTPIDAGQEGNDQWAGSNTEKRMIEINNLASNPDKLATHLQNKMSSISTAAPNTSFAIQSKLSTGIGYLNTLVPDSIKNSPMLAQDRLPVSNSEKDKFQNGYNMVNSPIKTTISAIKSNTFTPDMADALANVHPELYNEFISGIMNKISDNPNKPLSIAQQHTISTLIGKNISSQVGNDLAQFVQNNIYNKGSNQGSNGPPPKGKPSKMNVVSNELTPFQANQQRDVKES